MNKYTVPSGAVVIGQDVITVQSEIITLFGEITVSYDGPNGSLFNSLLLHNSEFLTLNSEF